MTEQTTEADPTLIGHVRRPDGWTKIWECEGDPRCAGIRARRGDRQCGRWTWSYSDQVDPRARSYIKDYREHTYVTPAGLFGATVEDVAERLICERLIQLAQDGWLPSAPSESGSIAPSSPWLPWAPVRR